MNTDKRNPASTVVICAAIASLLSGCMATPELSKMARDLEEQMPAASFEREFAFALGPFSLGLAKYALRFADDAHARDVLQGIRRVQIAVYKIRTSSLATDISIPERLSSLEQQGWETIIRIRDGGNNVWVTYLADEESIREINIVAMEDEELVLVNARGRLEQVAAWAIAEAGYHDGVPEVHREIRRSVRFDH